MNLDFDHIDLLLNIVERTAGNPRLAPIHDEVLLELSFIATAIAEHRAQLAAVKS